MLSDLDRRVIGNLSIPRNADDLALALRPYAVKTDAEGRSAFFTADEVDVLLRGRLTDLGYVVNLGQHTDPAALASSVQSNAEVMELPDEKAELWSQRMTRPDLVWRLGGDLWMLSEEGLKAMHAEPENTPPPMTPEQVQATINAEWARTVKGVTLENLHDHADELEGSVLLEDQFSAWLDDVLTDTKARWGEMAKNVHGPLAGGASGYSDAMEIAILDAENQKTNLASPAYIGTSWFMGLSILALTDADTGTTLDNGTHIPTYTGYGRATVVAASMDAASGTGGSVTNNTAIVFAACTAGTSTILAAANTSLATLGIIRKWFDVASTVVSTTQTPPQFAIGAYTTTVA